MTNELELRLECMRLAVAITPTLSTSVQDKITDNFNFILKNVTDNNGITFDSLKEKKVEDIMSNIAGIMGMADACIKGFNIEEEEELPVPKEEEAVKATKKKASQTKTEMREEVV